MLFLYLYIFILGLLIGSFLNCLIWRLHTGESMMERSHCPKCKKQIVWYDNIPLLSFLFLRGKCRHCGKKISWQYPIVELVTAILFVLALRIELGIRNYGLWFFSDSIIHNSRFIIQLFRDWFFISVMIVVFIYDLRWYLILDRVVLPAAILMLIFNLYLGTNWQNLLVSGIIGSSFFLIQFVISKGKWIGGGDIRLGLLMGFGLGWPKIVLAIFLAYLIGSIIGIFLMAAKKKKWGSQIPLGTFLSVAAIITLFWGDKILNWYLKSIGM